MKVLHIVPEINEANGVYRVARMLARESGGEVIDARQFQSTNLNNRPIEQFSEVWVHGMWLPREWKACWLALRFGKRLVRMTHGSLSPIYLEKQGKWKKRLVTPIERWLFRRTDRVVVTCEAEKKWCQEWGLKNRFEIVDLKRFFDAYKKTEGAELSVPIKTQAEDSAPFVDNKVALFLGAVNGGEVNRCLHLLYLGRRHPLKGVEFLERAVEELNQSFEHSEHSNNRTIDLRIVSDHFGEVLEKDWAWCDVLCLPTLSENFGLVVAEALERGKRVITTDGAPVWGEGELFDCSDCSDCSIGYGGRLVYLKGYRDGTDEERVRLLKDALGRL